MPITPPAYGSSSGFAKTTSKNYEFVTYQDSVGATAGQVLKFTRSESATETVDGDTWGAAALDNNEVLDASITYSVDEVVVDPSTEETAPTSARTFNPRAELNLTVLGEFTDSTVDYNDETFDVTSTEKSETSGDVVKTSVRGIFYGAGDGGLTVGDIDAGGTIRKEIRWSNTDFKRTTTTTVSFAAD